ncbi:MAG: SMC-Scp complex subunit ScpB [Planctomycetaceae bacterium]|jgi:segregation and condensation protein B
MSEPSEPQDSSLADSRLPVDDIELAYREALAALDEAEVQVGNALTDLADDDEVPQEQSEQAFVSIGEDLARDLQADGDVSVESIPEGRISPREVIEAALFVGGDVSLTARRLAGLIGSDVESRIAVKIIDQLNQDYSRDNRPYEIQLHEGGFRMQLREDFARLQSQVYGTGPKQIRLAPDVLEMLAFVAWNQPVDGSDLTQTGHDKPMTPIRQLIRLQLLEVERTGNQRTDVVYRTSQRFLELFDLKSLDDLPQADIFAFK